MSTTELILAVLLVVQSVSWMAHDYKHFEPHLHSGVDILDGHEQMEER